AALLVSIYNWIIRIGLQIDTCNGVTIQIAGTWSRTMPTVSAIPRSNQLVIYGDIQSIVTIDRKIIIPRLCNADIADDTGEIVVVSTAVIAIKRVIAAPGAGINDGSSTRTTPSSIRRTRE